MISNSLLDALRNQFAKSMATHAYIVECSRANITTVLKECAKIALCSNNGCGQCNTCNKVERGEHMDVITLPQDGRTKLNVEDIQYLVDESMKRPVDQVDCRVFLINATDSVGSQTGAVWQNKLLKTLEEPVGNTYIFVGVESADSLYQTIVSRCQVLRWNSQTAEQISAMLVADGYDKKYADIASILCRGNSLLAKNIVSDNRYYDIFDKTLSMLCELQSTKNALQYVSALSIYKDMYDVVLLSISALLRESVFCRISPQQCQLTALLDKVEKICDNYSIESCIAIIEMLNSVKSNLDNGSNYIIELDNLVADMLEVKYRCRT